MSESNRGCLIVVIGIDGAGKTTQVAMLGKWLQELGIPAETFLNPTLARVKNTLREIAHEKGYRDHLEWLGASTMRLISACAKLAHLLQVQDSVRRPASVTVVDRYTMCQYAAARAQGADNEPLLRRINRALPAPDLTLFLDVSPAIAAQRVQDRGMDRETEQDLQRLRDGYLALPEADTFRFVNADRDPVAVQADLRQLVRDTIREFDPSILVARQQT